MTVIALKDGVLAVDRFVGGEYLARGMTKLRTHKGFSMTGAGSRAEVEEMMRWRCALIDDPDSEYPFPPPSDERSFLVVVEHGNPNEALLYTKFADPTTQPAPWAWGSGAEIALGAMLAGASAIDAVRITGKLSPSCGFGYDAIDVVHGERLPQRRQRH